MRRDPAASGALLVALCAATLACSTAVPSSISHCRESCHVVDVGVSRSSELVARSIPVSTNP